MKKKDRNFVNFYTENLEKGETQFSTGTEKTKNQNLKVERQSGGGEGHGERGRDLRLWGYIKGYYIID